MINLLEKEESPTNKVMVEYHGHSMSLEEYVSREHKSWLSVHSGC